jgi:ABC-2 type transport system ATP-binding protein
MVVIDIQNLTKSYPVDLFKPKVTALHGISLQVMQGEVFGFLGQNGAGKTTTMKIMMGLGRPTSGTVTLLGRPHDDVAVRAQIGYLPEHPYFYDYLTASEFLRLYARLFGLSRFDPLPLLKQVGLEEALHQRLRKFSKGMLQRIGIAQAMINSPALLVLDEPMSGLDPVGRRQVRDLISRLKEEGKTVFFSSHIISDVETLCDQIAILHKGAIRVRGSIEELIGKTGGKQIVIDGANPAIKNGLSAAGLTLTDLPTGTAVTAPDDDAVWKILDQVRGQGGRIVSISDGRQSLEAFFLQTISGGA